MNDVTIVMNWADYYIFKHLDAIVYVALMFLFLYKGIEWITTRRR